MKTARQCGTTWSRSGYTAVISVQRSPACKVPVQLVDRGLGSSDPLWTICSWFSVTGWLEMLTTVQAKSLAIGRDGDTSVKVP